MRKREDQPTDTALPLVPPGASLPPRDMGAPAEARDQVCLLSFIPKSLQALSICLTQAPAVLRNHTSPGSWAHSDGRPAEGSVPLCDQRRQTRLSRKLPGLCLRASEHGLDELLSLYLGAETQSRARLGFALLTQGGGGGRGVLGTPGLLQTWPAVSGPLRTSHLDLKLQGQQGHPDGKPWHQEAAPRCGVYFSYCSPKQLLSAKGFKRFKCPRASTSGVTLIL